MPNRERVQEFIALVEHGNYVEAIQEFYAPDATMQENNHPPRIGLEALVKHEQGVIVRPGAAGNLRIVELLANIDVDDLGRAAMTRSPNLQSHSPDGGEHDLVPGCNCDHLQ